MMEMIRRLKADLNPASNSADSKRTSTSVDSMDIGQEEEEGTTAQPTQAGETVPVTPPSTTDTTTTTTMELGEKEGLADIDMRKMSEVRALFCSYGKIEINCDAQLFEGGMMLNLAGIDFSCPVCTELLYKPVTIPYD